MPQRGARNPRYRWQQIADDLVQRIQAGEYSQGEQLPSRRELRTRYQVSDIVLDRVMWTLREQGWVTTLHGVGTFVADALPGTAAENGPKG